MSRFLIAMFVGATIAAAASTSASAWHCLASSPNGAAGTAFGVILIMLCDHARVLARSDRPETMPRNCSTRAR